MSKIINECVVQTTSGDLSFSESGTSFNLCNLNRIKCNKIQVDGCLPIKGKKCDWAVKYKINSTCKYLLIELKGRKFKDAIEQLDNTILWFKQNSDFCLHKCYIVFGNRCPSSSGKQQILFTNFYKKHKIKIANVRSGCQKTIQL